VGGTERTFKKRPAALRMSVHVWKCACGGGCTQDGEATEEPWEGRPDFARKRVFFH
jgi:hypothetical protein